MKNKDEFIIPLALFTELFGNSMDEIVKGIDNIQKEAECFQKRYDEKKSEMTHRSRTFNRDEHRGHSCDVSYNNSTGTSGKKTNTDKLFAKDNAYFVEMLNRQRQENEKRKRHEMEQHKKVVDNFVNEVISKLEENVLRGKDGQSERLGNLPKVTQRDQRLEVWQFNMGQASSWALICSNKSLLPHSPKLCLAPCRLAWEFRLQGSNLFTVYAQSPPLSK